MTLKDEIEEIHQETLKRYRRLIHYAIAFAIAMTALTVFLSQ